MIGTAAWALFLALCVFQIVRGAYATRLALRGGMREVIAWLYHVTPSYTNPDPFAIPKGWEIALNESLVLLIMALLWRASRMRKRGPASVIRSNHAESTGGSGTVA